MEKLPVAGEPIPEDQQAGSSFPRSFAVVVKSPKFVQEAAEQGRKDEAEKAERLVRKEAEDQNREDEKRERELAKVEKARQKQEEEEVRRATHLAELAKKVEQATLHKKYVKNLHDKAKAEVEESTGYEREMEKLASLKTTLSNSGENTPKRGRSCTSSSSSPPPVSKKSQPDNDT